ncbi:MAG: type II toxin-antitoxin system VapC family toxin, partial [Ktedonobacteraceae bacterium]
MAPPKNLFWDSCVFIRYLTRQPTDFLADIDQYVAEAKGTDRKYIIHCSTLVFVEIRPRFLKKTGFGTAAEFMSDLGSAFAPFDPNPNILSYAGALRDHEPVNLGNPKSDKPATRSIGTPDAIHLATCLYLRDVAGVSDIVFHTFDEGKGKTWEGKCVPIIGFEKWFPPDRRVQEVADV